MDTYKLLADIPNPEFDGRCRYGFKSVKTFIQGTVFQGHTTRRDDTKEIGSTDWIMSFEPAYACHRNWHFSGTLAETLIANAQLCAPTTWQDLALVEGGFEHFAGDVLEELLATGVLSIDQIKNALTDCLAKNP